MSAELLRFLPHVAGMITLVAALVAAACEVLYKGDPRSAIGWVRIILLLPLAGPLIYALPGVNHIQRRALFVPDRSRHAAKARRSGCILPAHAEPLYHPLF